MASMRSSAVAVACGYRSMRMYSMSLAPDAENELLFMIKLVRIKGQHKVQQEMKLLTLTFQSARSHDF